MKLKLLAAALLCGATNTHAQVQYSGPATPGHVPSNVTNSVIQDAGPATAPNVTEFGVHKNGGLPLCVTDQDNPPPFQDPYAQMCFAVTPTQAQIVINSSSGAPPALVQLVNGQVIPIGGGFGFQVLNNVAALTGGTFGTPVQLLGYTTPGDLGGGLFFPNGTSCTPDNGTIFKDSSGNCFFRALPSGGFITPSMFGGVCGGFGGPTTDATAAVQAAINFIPPTGGAVGFPCTYNVNATILAVKVNGARGLTLAGISQGQTNGSGIYFTGNNAPILQLSGQATNLSNLNIDYANPQWVSPFTGSISGSTLTVTSGPATGALAIGMALHCTAANCGPSGYTTYEGSTISGTCGTNCWTISPAVPSPTPSQVMTAGFVASQNIQSLCLHDSLLQSITMSNGYDGFGIPQVSCPAGAFNYAFGNTFLNWLVLNMAKSAFNMTPLAAGEDNNTWINIYDKDVTTNTNQQQAMFLFNPGEGEPTILNAHMEFVQASSLIQGTQTQSMHASQLHVEGVTWLDDQALAGIRGNLGIIWCNACASFNIQGLSLYSNTYPAGLATATSMFLFNQFATGTVNGLYEHGTTTNGNTIFQTVAFGVGNIGPQSHVDVRNMYYTTTIMQGLPDNLNGNGQAFLYNNGEPQPVLFANRPTVPSLSQIILVTDSTTTTAGATVTGGGPNTVRSRWNGTNWIVSGY